MTSSPHGSPPGGVTPSGSEWRKMFDPPRPGSAGPVLTVRPRRVAIYGAFAAAVVLAAMIIVGILLQSQMDRANFRMFDQLGLISVGVASAGLIMLVARPRLRADGAGVWVRNILGETYFPWAIIERIAFPMGAHWAQLILPDDETYPVLAIQALDTERAVVALRRLRELYDEHRVVDEPDGDAADGLETYVRRRQRQEATAAANRQLGRLEVIDRLKAAQGPSKRQQRRAGRRKGV